MAKHKKNPHSSRQKFKLFRKHLLPIFLSIILFILVLITYQIIMADKFFPLTLIGDTNISLLTKGQAIRTVQSVFLKRNQQKLHLSFPQGTFTIDLATSSAQIDYSSLDENFNNTHSGPFIFFLTAKIDPKISLNLDKQLNKIASSIDKAPQDAELIFDETPASPTQEGSSSARILITEGVNGYSLDKNEVLKIASNFLLTGKYQSNLPLRVTNPKITTERVLKARKILEQLINKPIKLTFEDRSWTLDAKQLLALLDLGNSQDNFLDKEKTSVYLGKIAFEIDRPVAEGLFDFDPITRRVSAFRPSGDGRKLDQDKTFQLISAALTNPVNISLPVDITKPKIETADVNSLGIKELLGQGVSNFAGSITNRIYNIGLTASRINGVLIPPGETFSFNQTVGDITAATGFKQAYVIKEGRTVLDDGGGVCQDSTTLFRAVLNAGLPVVKRTAHAYRVGYYEQGFPPGLDATVYYPSVDFQFKNDTLNHILIQSFVTGNTLYVNLYGTSDGRLVNITQPVVTNRTPPPPELRQDEPTLAKGIVKQVDWAAWGANVSFKRTVSRNGEVIISETWRSNYKPWQAVYLVGTQ